MFHPLSVYVGLRYVRARSHKFFVSFITWASLVGVCVGVAALIVILSVMNGFESELRDRLLSLSAPVRATARPGSVLSEVQWRDAARSLGTLQGVSDVARYAEVQALAVRQPEMVPILLRGIDPNAASSRADLGAALTQGHLSDLSAGSNQVIVGAVIAERLGLGPGDSLTVLVPTVDAAGTPTPKLREFTVAGVFEVGLQDHDGTLVFAHLDDVRALGADATASEGLRVRVDNALAAPQVAARARALLPQSLEVSDWTQDNASYFRAIRIEKTMMSLILLMIVAVAAFNIVAMLVMVVTEKRTDIAILRTLGAAPGRIMGVFLTQGLVIGWIGVFSGVALGVGIALNVARIEPALERLFHFSFLDADVYSISELPSELHVAEVAWIAVAALLLTLLATIYPAWRGARTSPAEALRYE